MDNYDDIISFADFLENTSNDEIVDVLFTDYRRRNLREDGVDLKDVYRQRKEDQESEKHL